MALAATSANAEADPQFLAGNPALGYGVYHTVSGYPYAATPAPLANAATPAPLAYAATPAPVQKQPSGFYYHVQTVDTVKPKTIEVPSTPIVTAAPGYHYGYNGGAAFHHAGAYAAGAPYYNGAFAHPGYGYNGGLLHHRGYAGYPTVR